ncbi:TPA: TetR/AcrR family transcriptional regulator [Pseudomonas aeruginosa]|nr:TetR/AcrR family transcriptional regulator [Pseudomonas aeruginosa]
MPTSKTSALADSVPAAASPASKKAKQTRERILQAACDVVMGEGAGRLTLDAVVARAGVSKGAFLYHFKTKRDLLLTLIDDQVSAFDCMQDEYHRAFADDPDPWLSGQVASMPDGETQKLSGALLAAVAEDPTLLEPIRGWYRRQYQQVRKSPRTAEVAALVLLALDGLFFAEMMAFPTLDSAERHQLMGTLQALARGDLELTTAKKC